MKLLIVDDEKLTREGLMNSIDWKSIGISSVTQADDGIHGCDVALSFHPDIILSDIRMPRMDGIEMAEKLQNANPFLSIIFMSGFSDKEYLKAAIRLKAVSYVEKPIDLEEIKDAVREACLRVTESKRAASSHALSLSHSRSMLASALISAPGSESELPEWNELDFSFPIDDKTPFFTFLIRFYHNAPMQEELSGSITSLVNRLLSGQRLKEIHAARQDFLIFFHVWGFTDYDDRRKKALGGLIESSLRQMDLHYHLVFGKNVKGAAQIYDSYYSAVIELQNAFFTRENTCCIYQNTDSRSAFPEISSLNTNEKLAGLLSQKNTAAVNALMQDTFDLLLSQHNILPNQVRDFYYKLFTAVEDAYYALHISPDNFAGNDSGSYRGAPPNATAPGLAESSGSLWEAISNCSSIYTLHDLLLEKIRLFFLQAEKNTESNSSIYLIKKFIADHYMEETLSIKVISEHVFLSTSYLCTLFKNETGQTLNQYLTDFRIEKAKKLLRDPRYRITDISAQVGYSDGNYFGKIFKKSAGMSPSEYRDGYGGTV